VFHAFVSDFSVAGDRAGIGGGADRHAVSAAGNPCRVTALSEPPGDRAPSAMSITRCITWPEDGQDSAAVRCWTPSGRPISLCGHGLLCCGRAWHRLGRPVSRMTMNGMSLAFRCAEDLAWIGLPSIESRACRVPAWTRDVFHSIPWRAALAGDESGYLVLEWPAGFDLSSLPVPGSALGRRTGRSLIVTCADDVDPAFDIQLRYFAPQHGVPEDMATGSAMRVLASYWSNRELDERLTAWQCSPRGGVLRSRMEGPVTWIGGRVLASEVGKEDGQNCE
jgi:predicted PhzF superfamily epimerase YddE/YHI9